MYHDEKLIGKVAYLHFFPQMGAPDAERFSLVLAQSYFKILAT